MQTSLEQPARPQWWDWALAGGLALLTGLPYLFAVPLVGLVAVGQVAPLVWRRVHPVPVFGLIALATAAQLPLSDNVLPSNVAIMLALYALISWVSSTAWIGCALATCAAGAIFAGLDWAVVGVAGGEDLNTRAAIIIAIMCMTVSAATAGFGLAARRRRDLLVELNARALDAERERDQHAALAAQTERTRIAREMHDVIAHALAVIVVQSDGGAYAARHAGSPTAAAEALQTIGATSRGALAETRRLVSALREPGENADLAPSSGAEDIEALVAHVCAAGLPITFNINGVEDVSPGAGAAAYRVVQESLTNVIKHGGPGASATVEIARSESSLVVRVSDTGRGVTPDADLRGGYGLVGMHERVVILGGTMSTFPRPGGGFVVEAEIPAQEGNSRSDG